MLGRQPESRTFDPRQPLVREGAADYVLLQNGQRGLVREDGTYQLTNLGRRFFKNKYSQHVAHIPVVIRGMRRAGKNAGRAYERRDWLPANVPGGEASRQPDRLSEQQILQNVKQETLRLITAGDEDRAAGRAPIMELSDETYFYDPEGEWVVSSETTQYRNSRVHVETILRQRLRGLRRVSYQLPCFNSILECAFEDSGDNACVPRQLAQLLGVPFEEVCGDFDALAEHDWRAHGISPVEIRAFCARRNAPMVLISNTGEPLDRFEPAQRETKTVVFTYYDGHAFFYRNARPVLEQMGCALVMYRRDPKQTVPPLEEWSPWQGEIRPGHFHTTDLRETRRQLLLAEHNPQVTLRSLAQFSSLKLRAKGGQCVIRELPEDWELLQAWAKGLGLHYRGLSPRWSRRRGSPRASGRAGRQVRRLRAADRRRARGVRPHRAGAAGLRRAAAALPGALL